MKKQKLDFVNTVAAFVEKENLIPSGKTVCVCFSGGADSTALLHCLLSLRSKLNIALCACHLHHGIRGEEADADALFCKEMCLNYGIRYYEKRIDVPSLQKQSGKSLEETARDERYKWFSALGKEKGIDLFATAHHKDDLAETVLFRIIRGTTVDGLQGIPVKRDNLVRPLLCVTRAEIEDYLQANDLPYRHDSTNDSDAYSRNFVRHTLLPEMQKLNPKVTDALVRLSECAAEDCQALEQTRLLADANETAFLRRDIAERYRAISGKTLCKEQIDRILEACHSGNQTVIPLSESVSCVVRDGEVTFEQQNTPFPEITPFVLQNGETSLFDGIVRITLSDGKRVTPKAQSEFVYNLSTEIPLRSEGICGIIQCRSRLPGDRLRRFGVDRDLRKLFPERKIPEYLRPLLPVFCDESGVLFVPFVGTADRVYTKETGTIKWIRVDLDEEKARKER